MRQFRVRPEAYEYAIWPKQNYWGRPEEDDTKRLYLAVITAILNGHRRCEEIAAQTRTHWNWMSKKLKVWCERGQLVRVRDWVVEMTRQGRRQGRPFWVYYAVGEPIPEPIHEERRGHGTDGKTLHQDRGRGPRRGLRVGGKRR